jgi:dCTP deaminase
MSVMVDWQLNGLLESGDIKILPLYKNGIQSNSIDVRLGNNFAVYDIQSFNYPIDPYDKESVELGLHHFTAERITLEKNSFLLAETMERIELSDEVCATIEGKSSLARLGITVHQTGGWVDCGFRGTITLEMTNENMRSIILTAGMPIAQLVFYKTHHANVPYYSKHDAKYHDQTGATGSRYFENTP